MRFYRIVRFSKDRVRYAEVADLKPYPTECVSIPSLFPKVLDPVILWNKTVDRKLIKKIVIHNKDGSTWFELSSSYPIDAFMNMK
jgi:hypothetical protein